MKTTNIFFVHFTRIKKNKRSDRHEINSNSISEKDKNEKTCQVTTWFYKKKKNNIPKIISIQIQESQKMISFEKPEFYFNLIAFHSLRLMTK